MNARKSTPLARVLQAAVYGTRVSDDELQKGKLVERAYRVVVDERLFRAAWEHYGHTGPCPHHDGVHTCRQFEIGLRIREGCVSWLRADTAEEALERAACVLFDGVRIQNIAGYMG